MEWKCPTGCGDRAFALLTWLGFTLEGERGWLAWHTKRGDVMIGLDLQVHPTRTTLIALVTRLFL